MIKAIKVRVSGNPQFFQGRRSGETYHLPNHERRTSTFFDKHPVNQRTLIGIWQNLHQYTSHSNRAMRNRWKAANERFERHHMPYVWGRSTPRFVNEYTAHGWM